MERDPEKQRAPSAAESDSSRSDETTTAQHDQPPSREPLSRTVSRARSQNGYGVEEQDAAQDVEAQEKVPVKDPFEVVWDGGDDDPLCPRSFSKMRKWLIVTIAANVSLGV